MGEHIATRTCLECRTVSRDRGEDACPHCGAPFGASHAEAPSDAALPQAQAPAPAPPQPEPGPAPRPPPREPESRLEELIAQAAAPPPPAAPVEDLDPLGIPYAQPADPSWEEGPSHARIQTFAPEPARERDADPPIAAEPPTDLGQQTALLPHDLGEARLVRADIARHHDAELPWYLRRVTLIALGVAAVFLIALVAWRW